MSRDNQEIISSSGARSRKTKELAQTFGEFEAPPNSSLSEDVGEEQVSRDKDIKKNLSSFNVTKERKTSSRPSEGNVLVSKGFEVVLNANAEKLEKEGSSSGATRSFRTPKKKTRNPGDFEQDANGYSQSSGKLELNANSGSIRSQRSAEQNFNQSEELDKDSLAQSNQDVSQENSRSRNGVNINKPPLEQRISRKSRNEEIKKEKAFNATQENSQDVIGNSKEERVLPSIVNSSQLQESSDFNQSSREVSNASLVNYSAEDYEHRLIETSSQKKKRTSNLSNGPSKYSENQTLGGQISEGRSNPSHSVRASLKNPQEQEDLVRRASKPSEKCEVKVQRSVNENQQEPKIDSSQAKDSIGQSVTEVRFDDESFAVQNAIVDSYATKSSKQGLYSEDQAFDAEESDIYKISVDQGEEGSHILYDNNHGEESKDLKELLEKDYKSSSKDKNGHEEDPAKLLHQIEDSYALTDSRITHSRGAIDSIKDVLGASMNLTDQLPDHEKSVKSYNEIENQRNEEQKSRRGPVRSNAEIEGEEDKRYKIDEISNLRRSSEYSQGSNKNSASQTLKQQGDSTNSVAEGKNDRHSLRAEKKSSQGNKSDVASKTLKEEEKLNRTNKSQKVGSGLESNQEIEKDSSEKDEIRLTKDMVEQENSTNKLNSSQQQQEQGSIEMHLQPEELSVEYGENVADQKEKDNSQSSRMIEADTRISTRRLDEAHRSIRSDDKHNDDNLFGNDDRLSRQNTSRRMEQNNASNYLSENPALNQRLAGDNRIISNVNSVVSSRRPSNSKVENKDLIDNRVHTDRSGKHSNEEQEADQPRYSHERTTPQNGSFEQRRSRENDSLEIIKESNDNQRNSDQSKLEDDDQESVDSSINRSQAKKEKPIDSYKNLHEYYRGSSRRASAQHGDGLRPDEIGNSEYSDRSQYEKSLGEASSIGSTLPRQQEEPSYSNYDDVLSHLEKNPANISNEDSRGFNKPSRRPSDIQSSKKSSQNIDDENLFAEEMIPRRNVPEKQKEAGRYPADFEEKVSGNEQNILNCENGSIDSSGDIQDSYRSGNEETPSIRSKSRHSSIKSHKDTKQDMPQENQTRSQRFLSGDSLTCMEKLNQQERQDQHEKLSRFALENESVEESDPNKTNKLVQGGINSEASIIYDTSEVTLGGEGAVRSCQGETNYPQETEELQNTMHGDFANHESRANTMNEDYMHQESNKGMENVTKRHSTPGEPEQVVKAAPHNKERLSKEEEEEGTSEYLESQSEEFLEIGSDKDEENMRDNREYTSVGGSLKSLESLKDSNHLISDNIAEQHLNNSIDQNNRSIEFIRPADIKPDQQKKLKVHSLASIDNTEDDIKDNKQLSLATLSIKSLEGLREDDSFASNYLHEHQPDYTIDERNKSLESLRLTGEKLDHQKKPKIYSHIAMNKIGQDMEDNEELSVSIESPKSMEKFREDNPSVSAHILEQDISDYIDESNKSHGSTEYANKKPGQHQKRSEDHHSLTGLDKIDESMRGNHEVDSIIGSLKSVERFRDDNSIAINYIQSQGSINLIEEDSRNVDPMRYANKKPDQHQKKPEDYHSLTGLDKIDESIRSNKEVGSIVGSLKSVEKFRDDNLIAATYIQSQGSINLIEENAGNVDSMRHANKKPDQHQKKPEDYHSLTGLDKIDESMRGNQEVCSIVGSLKSVERLRDNKLIVADYIQGQGSINLIEEDTRNLDSMRHANRKPDQHQKKPEDYHSLTGLDKIDESMRGNQEVGSIAGSLKSVERFRHNTLTVADDIQSQGSINLIEEDSRNVDSMRHANKKPDQHQKKPEDYHSLAGLDKIDESMRGNQEVCSIVGSLKSVERFRCNTLIVADDIQSQGSINLIEEDPRNVDSMRHANKKPDQHQKKPQDYHSLTGLDKINERMRGNQEVGSIVGSLKSVERFRDNDLTAADYIQGQGSINLIEEDPRNLGSMRHAERKPNHEEKPAESLKDIERNASNLAEGIESKDKSFESGKKSTGDRSKGRRSREERKSGRPSQTVDSNNTLAQDIDLLQQIKSIENLKPSREDKSQVEKSSQLEESVSSYQGLEGDSIEFTMRANEQQQERFFPAENEKKKKNAAKLNEEDGSLTIESQNEIQSKPTLNKDLDRREASNNSSYISQLTDSKSSRRASNKQESREDNLPGLNQGKMNYQYLNRGSAIQKVYGPLDESSLSPSQKEAIRELSYQRRQLDLDKDAEKDILTFSDRINNFALNLEPSRKDDKTIIKFSQETRSDHNEKPAASLPTLEDHKRQVQIQADDTSNQKSKELESSRRKNYDTEASTRRCSDDLKSMNSNDDQSYDEKVSDRRPNKQITAVKSSKNPRETLDQSQSAPVADEHNSKLGEESSDFVYPEHERLVEYVDERPNHRQNVESHHKLKSGQRVPEVDETVKSTINNTTASPNDNKPAYKEIISKSHPELGGNSKTGLESQEGTPRPHRSHQEIEVESLTPLERINDQERLLKQHHDSKDEASLKKAAQTQQGKVDDHKKNPSVTSLGSKNKADANDERDSTHKNKRVPNYKHNISISNKELSSSEDFVNPDRASNSQQELDKQTQKILERINHQENLLKQSKASKNTTEDQNPTPGPKSSKLLDNGSENSASGKSASKASHKERSADPSRNIHDNISSSSSNSIPSNEKRVRGIGSQSNASRSYLEEEKSFNDETISQGEDLLRPRNFEAHQIFQEQISPLKDETMAPEKQELLTQKQDLLSEIRHNESHGSHGSIYGSRDDLSEKSATSALAGKEYLRLHLIRPVHEPNVQEIYLQRDDFSQNPAVERHFAKGEKAKKAAMHSGPDFLNNEATNTGKDFSMIRKADDPQASDSKYLNRLDNPQPLSKANTSQTNSRDEYGNRNDDQPQEIPRSARCEYCLNEKPVRTTEKGNRSKDNIFDTRMRWDQLKLLREIEQRVIFQH